MTDPFAVTLGKAHRGEAPSRLLRTGPVTWHHLPYATRLDVIEKVFVRPTSQGSECTFVSNDRGFFRFSSVHG